MTVAYAKSLAWIAALNHAASLLADPSNHAGAFDDHELHESTKDAAYENITQLADELRKRALDLERAL